MGRSQPLNWAGRRGELQSKRGSIDFSWEDVLGTSDDGSTAVYSGRERPTGREMAVKVESQCVQLHNENCMLMRLRNSLDDTLGIPTVQAYRPGGQEDKRFYLAMESLGDSLQSVLAQRENGKLDAREVCQVATQCLEVLQRVHDGGVVHRDVKPGNILVGKRNPRQLWLIDFGISEPYPPFMRRQNRACTLSHASTGCHRKEPLSRKDDLESLGFTLLELALGELPWSDELERLTKGRSGSIPAHSHLRLADLKDDLAPSAASNIPGPLGEALRSYLSSVRSLPSDANPEYGELSRPFEQALVDLGAQSSTAEKNESFLTTIAHAIRSASRNLASLVFVKSQGHSHSTSQSLQCSHHDWEGEEGSRISTSSTRPRPLQGERSRKDAPGSGGSPRRLSPRLHGRGPEYGPLQ